MRRILTILAIGAVFCLFVPLAVAEKPSKPGGGGGGGGHDGGGGGGKVTTQLCDITGAVEGVDIEVGIDPKTYGSQTTLDLKSAVLAVGMNEGPYFGQARVLKANTSSRFDFYFRTDQNGLCLAPKFKQTYPSGCDYRLILVNGQYTASDDVVSFDPDEQAQIYLIDANTGEYLRGNASSGGDSLTENVTITFAQ
jgi:hypothetical protein